MADVESLEDPEFVNWYNKGYMPHVRGYSIYITVLIVVHVLWQCCGLRYLKQENFPGLCFFVTFLLICLSQLASCVLEAVAYDRLSVHYDMDLIAPLRDATTTFKGCGGPNFNIALQGLEESIIYERPVGQIISLIFGWLLMISIIAYFVIVICMINTIFDQKHAPILPPKTVQVQNEEHIELKNDVTAISADQSVTQNGEWLWTPVITFF